MDHASRSSRGAGSVAVAVPSEGRASFRRVASVVRQDFERPCLERLRFVSGTQSPLSVGTQFVSRASAAPFVRTVALVPGSPDSTPRSIQDLSRSSNRFSVLADQDDVSFEGGASSCAVQTTVLASSAHVRAAHQYEAVAMFQRLQVVSVRQVLTLRQRSQTQRVFSRSSGVKRRTEQCFWSWRKCQKQG